MYLHQVNIVLSVNFDGFHDDESGINQFIWAVGRSICTNDVVNFSDPHEFVHSVKYWTYHGYEKNLNLKVKRNEFLFGVRYELVFGDIFLSFFL